MKQHFKFRLTLLSLALAGGFAHAADVQENVELQTVEVKGDRQGSKVKTNVVTLREKQENTATDLRGLLFEEPAIDFGGGTGAAQFLTIRGMGQNSVDIKIDNAYSDSQILYHQGRFIIDPSLIKIVSVQKGAGSASAGIGATNGAIVTKTVDALDFLKDSERDYGARVSAGYSSNDGHNYGVTLFGKAGNFDGLVSYNKTDEKDYKPGNGYTYINGGDKVPYSAMKDTAYLAKLGATFDNHRFVLSHFKDKQAGVRTVREEFIVADGRLSPARQAPAYRETSLSNTNLEWTASNLGFIQNLTANTYWMETERYSADDSGCGYCGSVAGPTTTKIKTRGSNINLDIPLGDNTLLKYGINYRHQKIDPHRITAANYTNAPEKTDVGTYLEAIHDIGKFTLTGGLRYDYFKAKANDGVKASDSNLNPSVGVIYQATPNLSLSANHNYATRSPRLYDALLVGQRRVSFHEGLNAERARNTEIGFNYRNGGFALNGTYFWQKVKDLIVNPQQRHDANGNIIAGQSEAVNDGYSKNRGYEVDVSYRYNGWTARAGVAESKPQFHLNTTTEVNPEFAIPVGRTWTTSLAYRFNRPNLELGWRGRYIQRSKETVVAGATLRERPGFGVHDVFLNWKPINKDTFNVNFSVNNVFNKFYYPHSQRAAVTTWPGVGRDFRLGINYQF